jgi:hypothetical protein
MEDQVPVILLDRYHYHRKTLLYGKFDQLMKIILRPGISTNKKSTAVNVDKHGQF